jgi:hypothetical protein
MDVFFNQMNSFSLAKRMTGMSKGKSQWFPEQSSFLLLSIRVSLIELAQQVATPIWTISKFAREEKQEPSNAKSPARHHRANVSQRRRERTASAVVTTSPRQKGMNARGSRVQVTIDAPELLLPVAIAVFLPRFTAVRAVSFGPALNGQGKKRNKELKLWIREKIT